MNVSWLHKYPDTQLRDLMLDATICLGVTYEELSEITFEEYQLMYSWYKRKKEADLMPWCNLYALICNIMSGKGKKYEASDFLPKRELSPREIEQKIFDSVLAAGAVYNSKR